jgi:L-cysteine S-thiosulfotransferase
MEIIRRGDFMKRIIFVAILGALLLQGCKTTPATKAATPAVAPAAEVKKEVKPIEMDAVKIMTNPNIGNCTACHAIPAVPSIVAGDMGPPFIGMKGRFPDIAKLRAAIADQKAIAPQTIMPPFGRNKLLTPEQIDVVAQYIYQY